MSSPKPYSWLPRALFPLGRCLIRLQLRKFVGRKPWQKPPLEVVGPSVIPTGGLLIIANHRSDIDPPLVQYNFPRGIHFMGQDYLFEMKIWGPAIRFFHAFPISRGKVDRAALRHAIELLKMGEVVCIFPEGGITTAFGVRPLEPGVTLILRQTGATVLCCGLQGTGEFLSGGDLNVRVQTGDIRVVWGQPMQFSKDAEPERVLETLRTELIQLSGMLAVE